MANQEENKMFVDKSMHKNVITIGEKTRVLEARDIMKSNHIRHLPVVDADNKLVGVVTDRDIRSAMPSVFLDSRDMDKEKERLTGLRAGEIMTREVVTISPSYTIQDALLLIQKQRVGAFPVVDQEGKLKGIISVRDLVRAFVNVMGIGEPGTLLGIVAEEKVGQLKKIVDAITEENVSFGSVLVARYWEEGKRAVFPYLLTNTVAPVKKKLQDMGFTLLDPMDWYLDQLPKND